MTKERMELHENRAKKQLYRRFWRSIPERISKGTEHFFYRLGMHISQNPFKWLLGCFIIMLFCLSGLFRFRQEKNPVKLWSPPDSSFALDTDWIMSHFENGLRIQTFILTGNNVLEQQTLIRLNEITKQIISTQAPIENISWRDICMKIPSIAGYTHRRKRQNSLSEDDFFEDDLTLKVNQTLFEPAIHTDTKLYCDILESLPMACLMFSILDIWNFDSAKIKKDSTEEIITKINTVKVSPTLGHSMNFSELLGGVTLDEKGRIIAATAIKTELMVQIKFLNVDMDKSGNTAGTADWATYDVLTWESAFLELATKIVNELQSEKNNNDLLTFYYEAGRSYGDLSGTAMFQDIDKLIIGVALMFLFVLAILSNHNWVEWRFCLTSVGLFCVGIAFMLAVGICSLIGIPYGPIHTSLPFLLLGLGVDDIFVFNAFWIQIHTDELILSKSLTERIGLTLGRAGPAITVTSFTDIVAFIIGTTTILPSLRSFCIYAAVGISMTYLLQITFFIACFTLDARRIEQKRNGMLPCIVHQNFTPKLSDPSKAFSWKCIHVLYSRAILTMPGKIIIIIITFAMMSISITGTLQLKQGFDPALLIPKGSYLDQYIITNNKKFSDQGVEAFVLMGDDIDYSSEFSKIISLTERLKNESFIQNIEPWPINFAKFVSTYYNTDLKTTKITDDHFYHYLSKFLVSRTGGKYQRNFVFNETFMCGKIAPRIIATTIEFKFTRFVSPSEWIPAMDDSKHLVSKAQIEGYVTVWSKFFGPWTSDKMITQEVSRNLILGLICVMCTTAILIVEVHTCFWILLCILLTLLNVCGFMYFWGQPIDMVSSIGLQLAIGLSVDYAAHVAHAFLHTEAPEDDDDAPRTTRALIAVRHIGAAVAYGAGSTLFAVSMLAFSTSYVFIAFFRIFFLVILFGLWHGLIMLPVVLSIIGPPSLRVTKRPQPMSVAVVDDED
ncbi:NPC1-like intracellular cholesterol transporter 1 [Formica exsecta]|uniref:NPC1-like intracellular cholesterol transporter 1 n=1 Tax=Formica exsecta TaxID=72781 RepID=UPI001144F64A|nr:NPC1-like intracellular cholesterol transporter 1 [Formica exsecta]XP_029679287.1 NPC1-like intracellular cholesterol transporter 1 [Formica exsecta]XP_029679288.1 NPC1-like intracellular cholesterol transporter 1 [Formica exsecta]XP_029679289.1 NPC1-like intracellular cholesterol transporter 1 [Formica exsecta]